MKEKNISSAQKFNMFYLKLTFVIFIIFMNISFTVLSRLNIAISHILSCSPRCTPNLAIKPIYETELDSPMHVIIVGKGRFPDKIAIKYNAWEREVLCSRHYANCSVPCDIEIFNDEDYWSCSLLIKKYDDFYSGINPLRQQLEVFRGGHKIMDYPLYRYKFWQYGMILDFINMRVGIKNEKVFEVILLGFDGSNRISIIFDFYNSDKKILCTFIFICQQHQTKYVEGGVYLQTPYEKELIKVNTSYALYYFRFKEENFYDETICQWRQDQVYYHQYPIQILVDFGNYAYIVIGEKAVKKQTELYIKAEPK